MQTAVSNRVREYIASHDTLVLATASNDQPWAAALFYVSDPELRLYFISDPDTQHVNQALENPLVSASITDQNQSWQAIQGVQIRGRIAVVDAVERAQVEQMYSRKFPFLAKLLDSASGADEQRVKERFLASKFYALMPDYIRFVDNTQGFGFKEEYVD